MAEGTKIAQAYVQIVPTTKGISNQLSSALGGEGDKTGKSFGSTFAASAGKALAVGGAAVVAAAGALVKNAVSAFADYEQLSGGVEKIFGDMAYIVEYHAKEAYKTAGMSANQYMETVTSFSASLIKSVGGDTQRAAIIADKAIRDMADNANAFGTSIESIQNAYQGFAKGNYTMLDNLKLGYAGTQQGMIDLINDSGVLEDKIESLDGIGMDTIIAAIHQIQENLNIAGTTAAEAEGTISGSIATLKATFTNFITGLGQEGADVTALTDNMIAAFENVVANIQPVLMRIVEAIPALCQALAPAIADMLPALISAAVNLIANLIPAIIQNLPTIVKAIIVALVQSLPTIVEALNQAFNEMILMIIELGVELVKGIWQGISQSFEWIKSKIKEWVGNVLDFFKNLFGISSPSKVMADQIGRYLPAGIAQGISDNSYLVDEAMDELMSGSTRTATVAANVTASSAGLASGTNGDIYALLVRYLPILAANGRTPVVLEADASALFKSVQGSARTFKKATGQPAFG